MKKNNAYTYAIVDIETTGGRPDRDKITEIGIVLHNGREITETYSTLINPGVSIPPFITQITGIHQEMVEDAPRFHEVARDILLRLDKAVFVAHNARFDYHFLRESYRDLGFTLSRPWLCTVKLSRQYFPGLPSYSLENLIRHFNIPAERRHRALDDALATAELFGKIMKLQDEYGNNQPTLSPFRQVQATPSNISPDKLDQLPAECGVYYFYNSRGDIIYIGKSLNIRRRVREHLSSLSRKSNRLDRDIADIKWVITGSELYAVLLESYEIKRHLPELNRAQRVRITPWQITLAPHHDGVLQFRVSKAEGATSSIQQYASARGARQALNAVRLRFGLCRHYTLEQPTGKPCFEHMLGECTGVCAGLEPIAKYNEKAAMAASYLRNDIVGSFYLIDRGPTAGSQCIFAVHDGHFTGMGIVEGHHWSEIGELATMIQVYDDNPEVRLLLRHHMAKKNYERIPIEGVGG